MAEVNRVADLLEGPDDNTRRFHIGNMPQVPLPGDLAEEEQAALDAHRAAIKVPEPRPPFGTDEEGNPRTGPAAEEEEEEPARTPTARRDREEEPRRSEAHRGPAGPAR